MRGARFFLAALVAHAARRRTRLRAARYRRIDAEMRVKSCWNRLGHGRLSKWKRCLNDD